MKIVWIQRYPSDTPTPLAMDNGDTAVYVSQKQDDYRYNSGQVWVEDVTTSGKQKGKP